jgi:hypothetical protein
MAIQFVGSQSIGKVGQVAAWPDETWALTGGIASTPSVGDFVVYNYTTANNVFFDFVPFFTGIGVTPVAYFYVNGTNDTNMGVAYKFLSSVPAGFPVIQSGSTAAATVSAVSVFRGVSTLNPLDVAAVTASGTGTGVPSTVSITPVTSGAVAVYCVGAAGVVTTPVVFTNATLSGLTGAVGADSQDSYASIGYRTWSSGAIDSGTWSPGATTSASNTWAACALALRPSGSVKYWNGSAWVVKPVKYWNGSAWVAKPVKYWNGSAWVMTNY